MFCGLAWVCVCVCVCDGYNELFTIWHAHRSMYGRTQNAAAARAFCGCARVRTHRKYAVRVRMLGSSLTWTRRVCVRVRVRASAYASEDDADVSRMRGWCNENIIVKKKTQQYRHNNTGNPFLANACVLAPANLCASRKHKYCVVTMLLRFGICASMCLCRSAPMRA